MERVIVTVKKYNEAMVRDLDVPAELAVNQLADLVASSLNWDQDSTGEKQTYDIKADPPGRVLKSDESLLEAGVVDGAWLTFVQEGVKQFPDPVPQQNSGTKSERTQGPVKGWKTLEGVLKEDDSQQCKEDQDQGDQGPYVWKEVDV